MPTDWIVAQLGDLGSFSKGIGIKKDQVLAEGIPCVRYGQIYTEHDAWIRNIQSFVSLGVAESSRTLQSGEILFAGSGETKAEIGKCVAYLGAEPTVAGGDIVILTPSNVDSLFLGYALNAPQVAVQKMARAQGDAVVHISAANLSTIFINLPPRAEQEAIAEALSDADAAIESLEALIAKKRDIKQATMQQLLTGRTRLAGFDSDWKSVRLGDHATMRSGGTPITTESSYYGGPIPWVSISDMTKTGKYIRFTERYLTETGIANSSASIFPSGVLLYAMYASIGQCCISTVEMSTSQAILGITCAPSLNLEFLYYTMQFMRAELIRAGQQGTQANLNLEMVKNVKLLLPSLEEQGAISETLGALDEDLVAFECQLSKLLLVKQGMMQDLLTGKVRLV